MKIYNKEGKCFNVVYPVDALEAIRSGEYTFEDPSNSTEKAVNLDANLKKKVEMDKVEAEIRAAAEADRKVSEEALADKIAEQKKTAKIVSDNPNAKIVSDNPNAKLVRERFSRKKEEKTHKED